MTVLRITVFVIIGIPFVALALWAVIGGELLANIVRFNQKPDWEWSTALLKSIPQLFNTPAEDR